MPSSGRRQAVVKLFPLLCVGQLPKARPGPLPATTILAHKSADRAVETDMPITATIGILSRYIYPGEVEIDTRIWGPAAPGRHGGRSNSSRLVVNSHQYC